MRLWGNSETPEEGAEPAPRKASGFEGMILQFIANNPELKATIDSFTTGLQQFAQNQQAVLTEIREVKALLVQQAALNGRAQAGPQFGGTGVISDGVRCPTCGTTGECECYANGSGGDGSGSGDASGGGSASRSISG
jgi:hypothetical protein